MTDWVEYQTFIEQQVADALARLDNFIDEHEGEERQKMMRQRPRVAAQLEAQIRMHFAREVNQ